MESFATARRGPGSSSWSEKQDPSRTFPFRANDNVQTDGPTPAHRGARCHHCPSHTGCRGHGRGHRGQESETWGQCGERRHLAYRECETKSYTGIWTVFPSVISLRVLKMSSLSKASEGNQGVTRFFLLQ